MANIGDRVIGVYPNLNMRVLIGLDGEYVTLKGPRAGELGRVLDPAGKYLWDQVAVLRYSEEIDRRVVELVDLLAEVRRATGAVQLELGLEAEAQGAEGIGRGMETAATKGEGLEEVGIDE